MSIWILILSLFVSMQHARAQIPLFTLERTTNANRLVYEWTGAEKMPLHAFWQMLAEDGHKEELTSMEKNYAYGIHIIEETSDHLRFTLRAMQDRPISVKFGASPTASMLLLGEERILKSIYIHLSPGILPRAKQIELRTKSLTDDKDLVFILEPSGSGWSERALL